MAVDLKPYDYPQVLRSVFEVEDNCLRVKVINSSGSGGELEVIVTHTEDSVRLGDGTNFFTSTSGSGKVALDVNFINSSLPITATDLDIRDLQFSSDKVDVSGSSVAVDNFPTIQTVQGDTLFLSGTANANNTNIIDVVDVSGYDTVIIHNTGTYNLTAQAQFSNNGINFVAVLGQSLAAAGTAPSTTVSTTNAIFKVPVSGRFFRYRTTAYTSGTITANVYISVNDINDFGSRNNTISGTVTTSGTITAGNTQVTGTGSALNATPIASTVVGQYDAAVIALTGTWNAILVAEGSNNNTDWFNVPVQQINSLSALPQLNITSNGLYKVPLQFNNFRLRITNYTSGTVSANARISAIDSENLNPKQIIEAGTASNTYNEVLSVASGILTNLASFTAIQNTRLKQVDVSGENVASYEVLVNGNIVSKKRTYFGGPLDTSFFFDKGINFLTGQQVLVRVVHNRPSTANFNANIILIEG